MNAYQKIRKSMKDNDRKLLKDIKDTFKKTGQPWQRPFLLSFSMYNSLKRLEKSNKIKYSRRYKYHGYIPVVKH